MTTVVLNPKNQELLITPPTANTDGSPLALSAVTGFRVACGNTQGGPYPKTVEDTDLKPDANGVLHFPLASLGVDLSKPTFIVAYTDVVNAESVASAEIGVQNVVPNAPALSVA